MTNINDNTNKDERALEALMAAAFRLDFPEEVSDEEAVKFFEKPARLSPEDKEACNSWGTDFIDKLLEGQKTTPEKQSHDIIVNEALEQEYYAMNRGGDEVDLDDEARRKIDEEREKAIEEEDSKDEDQNNES